MFICHVFTNATCDKFSFLSFTASDEEADFVAVSFCAPEFFFIAIGIAFNQGVGSLKNVVCTAVILIEGNDFGSGKIFFSLLIFWPSPLQTKPQTKCAPAFAP
jgi:hypothetical protein